MRNENFRLIEIGGTASGLGWGLGDGGAMEMGGGRRERVRKKEKVNKMILDNDNDLISIPCTMNVKMSSISYLCIRKASGYVRCRYTFTGCKWTRREMR